MTNLPPSASAPTGALPSETILQNRYLVQKRLGQGGMGAVYLAHDQRLDIECAIKEMSTSLLHTDEERERARRAFHEEAKLLARLQHPNLPRVTDHFSENGKEYLVMEFVPGETLAQVLRATPPPWPVADVVKLAEALIEVLHYLHTRTPPIIFRDLKPGNVMRMPDGKIKLIDFGIARLFKPGQSHDTQAIGTMGYSAPEQYGQGQTDARSDVYTLGVMLHQIATGHDPVVQPFNIPLARKLNPQIPEAMSEALRLAMCHEPDERFASMPAFRKALTASATPPSPSSPFIAPPPQRASGPQPQVGYNPAASAGYNQPTPQGGYGPPARSGAYNQPTPQGGYGPPTPQGGYSPPARSGAYNQPTPQGGYGPPTPQGGYSQPVQPVSYNQPTPQGGYAPPSGPMVGLPTGGPGFAAAGQPYTTKPSSYSRYAGAIAIGTELLGMITASASYDLAIVFMLIALVAIFVGFVLSLIGLLRSDAHLSLKGRAHAGLGMGLVIGATLFWCVAGAVIVPYANS